MIDFPFFCQKFGLEFSAFILIEIYIVEYRFILIYVDVGFFRS